MKTATIQSALPLIAILVFHLSSFSSVGIPEIPRNGKIAFMSERDGDREIYTMNPDGSGQTRLTVHPGIDDYPSWSPDGRKIAFLSSVETGGVGIFLMNVDGTGRVQIGNLPSTHAWWFATHISWSPDGTRVAFTMLMSDPFNSPLNTDIAVANLDGSGQVNITSQNPRWDSYPEWSPDGSTILFASSRNGVSALYTMAPNGSNVTFFMPVTRTNGFEVGEAAFSPRGGQLIFSVFSWDFFTTSLYLANEDGSSQQLFEGCSEDLPEPCASRFSEHPSWSPDGTSIVYTFEDLNNADTSDIYSKLVAGGAAVRLTKDAGKNSHPSWQSMPRRQSQFDFDGDGKTDVSIFRPNPSSFIEHAAPEGSSSQWWIFNSGSESALGITFGQADDVIVPSDYTGDGKADVAFFRPSDSTWYLLRSEDFTFFAFPFGVTGDIPAPGDFDGDGTADPAVFRPSAGTWFILRSSDSGISAVPFGIAEDKPIVADYDGDGMDDVAVYRPSVNQWWLLRSTAGVLGVQFGSPGDRSVIGDWTGDGKADIAFYRSATSEFYVIKSEDSSFFAFPWGAAGDIQAPGDFDGDGIMDAAVYRPSIGTWFINGSISGFQAVQFGMNGDVPLPSSVSVR